MSYIPFDPLVSLTRFISGGGFVGQLEFRWGPHNDEPIIVSNNISTLGMMIDDLTPAMEVTREFLIEDMEDRFNRQVDLNGRPWKKRNSQYQRWLNKNGYKGRKILQKDHHLVDAVTDRSSYVVTPKTLAIDTSKWPPYWHAHNVGSTVGRGIKLPQREFLGMSEAMAFRVAGVFDDYVDGLLKIIPAGVTGIPMQRSSLGTSLGRIRPKDLSRQEVLLASGEEKPNFFNR